MNILAAILAITLIIPAYASAEERSFATIAKLLGTNLAAQLKGVKGSIAIADVPYGTLDDTFPGGKYLSNSIGNEFINSGFTVVDRGSLDRILSEQKVQSNQLFDASTAARVGKLAGASYFIFGRFFADYQRLRVTFWAVDVQTGLIVAADEQHEFMAPALEKDLDAMLPGLTSLNNEVKRYRARERVCQIMKPGIDLAEIAKIYRSYLPEDKDGVYRNAPYYSNLRKEDVGDKGYGNIYPSGWTFDNWFVTDSEGEYETSKDPDGKRGKVEIALSKKHSGSSEALKEKFKSGQPTGILIKSWVLLGMDSVPSTPYCLPDGSPRVNKNVDSKVRIPVDDGTPLNESVLVKISDDLFKKISVKLKSVSGKLAIPSYQNSGLELPMAAVQSLEDQMMVRVVKNGLKVVDRGMIQKIIGEQKMQQSSLFNPGSLAKIGKLAGADFLLLGNVERTPTRVIYSVRVVNVSTGVFIAQAETDAKNNLALDEEFASSLSFSKFTHPLDDDMRSSVNFEPPQYMGPTWRDKLRRFKFSVFSDWICQVVSPAGNVSGIVAEGARRGLIVVDEHGSIGACKNKGSSDNSEGDVLMISSSFENPLEWTNAYWKFDVVQSMKGDFCKYVAESQSVAFDQALTMKAWRFEGPAHLAPDEDNGFRENCLKEGLEVWNVQRRDKKKKIR